ncbi:RimJ/RimL family protein N-acetyltransferase [Streptacidiphilus sp. MAP12-33]|uniref:GNAT family N-acetyltransferase n=1 Tax=Streptacidiphilus sp. MAP12-33 TaxID=3156266 RepID=UPI00351800A4
MIPSVPPVVPAGRMAAGEQPVRPLPSGALLRPWQEGDEAAIVEAALDPGIQRWSRPGRGVTEADARERIARWRRRWRSEEAAIWAVVAAGAERPVGLIGWADVDLVGGSAEVLYWLLPAGRGTGLGTEALVEVSRWAVEELGLQRLRLTHSVANPASCRVAERAGFAYEGTMRGALLHEDGWHDEHLHARVRGDAWPV